MDEFTQQLEMELMFAELDTQERERIAYESGENDGYNQALEDLKFNLEEEKKTYAYNGYSLDTDKWLDDYLNSKLG